MLDQGNSSGSPTAEKVTPAPEYAAPEFPNEDVLPDDYPVYGDYFYVADGKLYRCNWHGITVRALKIHENFQEVRRCNISARRAASSAEK